MLPGMGGPSAAGGTNRLRHAAIAVGLVILALVAVVLFALPDHDRAATIPSRTPVPQSAPHRRVTPPRRRPAAAIPAPATATVTISSPLQTVSVPRSFLGLSTEYWSLPVYEGHMSLFERVLSLVHVPGDGPVILRVGGDSADHAFWEPRPARTAPWVFSVTPSFLRATARVVRRVDVRLLLDLNLITGSSHGAAELSRAAERALPPGSIIGFEIGNEPDVYSRRYWLAAVSQTPLRTGFLRKELSTATYLHEFEAYGHALAAVAPGVPLAGPAVENPARNLYWIARLIAAPHPGLTTITAHRYVFSRCAPRRSRNYPTVARLLSARASAVGTGVTEAVRLAHQAGFEFRLTELNSVACEGVPGVSNTFATALWASDTLFGMLRAGVNGVNVHVRTGAINAAFTLSRSGLQARPLLYGLILFARMLGPNSQLVRVRLHARPSLNLDAWATRVSGDSLNVLLIDKGSRPVSVSVRVPGHGPANVRRLLAPTAGSTSGVTFAGRRLGRDARWHGPVVIQKVPPDARGYRVLVPRTSAALVSIRLGGVGRGLQRRSHQRH